MIVDAKTMQKFFAKYKDRYGDSRMNSETMSMWWDKLGMSQNSTFIQASEILLGSREVAFGWKMLQEKIAQLDPEADEQAQLTKKWQGGREYQTNIDKKKELTRIMNDLLDKVKLKKGYPKWREEYVVEFVRIWGPEDAYKIAQGAGRDQTFTDFAAMVFDLIRKQKKE